MEFLATLCTNLALKKRSQYWKLLMISVTRNHGWPHPWLSHSRRTAKGLTSISKLFLKGKVIYIGWQSSYRKNPLNHRWLLIKEAFKILMEVHEGDREGHIGGRLLTNKITTIPLWGRITQNMQRNVKSVRNLVRCWRFLLKI